METSGEAAGEASTAASYVGGLVDGYRATKRQLDTVPDAFERTIGYAALQSHARATAKHLNTTALGVTRADIEPLTAFAEDMSIGGAARGPAGFGMEAARSAFTETPIPLAAGGLGIIGVIASQISDLGGLAGTLLLGGGGVLVVWILYFVVRGANSQLDMLWKRAKNMGSAFESAYETNALPVEQQLWASAGGAPHSGVRFVPTIRMYAMLGVVALWVLVIGCGVVFAYGAVTTMQDISDKQFADAHKFP
ncbi:MAG: hypothetical protein ABI577_17825 [bacterium]